MTCFEECEVKSEKCFPVFFAIDALDSPFRQSLPKAWKEELEKY